MRLRKNPSDTRYLSHEAGASKRRRREGRGLGPFSGGQLTTVIVALVFGVVAYPFAAGAASAIFTSKSNTVPAVKATNSGTAGIGVQGTGKKYGVLSNGPLGVAAGKPLSCTGCVGANALAASAKQAQPLAPGQSESGAFSAIDETLNAAGVHVSISFPRPIPWPVGLLPGGGIIPVGQPGNTTCPGPGSAAPGAVCLYDTQDGNITPYTPNFLPIISGKYFYGVIATYLVTSTAEAALAIGVYTVTAP